MRQTASRALVLLCLLALAPAGARATCSTNSADVAPGLLGTEVPTPVWTVTGDGAVDVQDVLVILNAAVGTYSLAWAPPVGPSCPAIPGNVSPGNQDDGFSPPRWTPSPDSGIDVGDVLVTLRLAVLLIELDPDWLTPILSDGEVGDRVVAGSVIDSISAAGLPAVLVTAILDESPLGETETDAEGKFLLQGLPSGQLRLRLDGRGSSAAGKFSTLEVEIVVDTAATTSVQPFTLADETDPAGATGKFTGDETGTVDESIELSSDDGDVGLATGPGGKIEVDGEPADGEVDLSVVPIEGEDLPEGLTDDAGGEGLNSTGEVAVGPADGKFTGGGAGLAAVGGEPGFDLTLPNRHELPLGKVVDIWHWNGASWTNCTAATGRSGEVIATGEGMTAVFAAGVATEGGLYAAAVPIDLSCTSSLSGFVTDDVGGPLARVFVGTSLGASAFTDELGNFFIPDLPAYTGADLADCLAMGYEVFVRGGVELGGATGGAVVEDFDVFVGSETHVGEILLTVPNEGCLSGLVLSNGVGLSGPVTITGPEPGLLMADDEGRFFQPGLAPGLYRASFQFPGEPLPREFEFEIVARRCTAVRLAVNAGAGSRRLTVQVLYDDDDNLVTANGPASGALVRLVGADAVSALGFEAVTGAGGLAVFDAVDPPYDIVAMIERPVEGSYGLGRAGVEGRPIMRIGSGLVTSAPAGRASLLLRLPLAVDSFEAGPDGAVIGTVSNLPVPGVDELLRVVPLRRGAHDAVWGDYLDPPSGDYTTGGFLVPFDLAVALVEDSWLPLVHEMALFGPFQLPAPMNAEDFPQLTQDLDYSMGDRLVFDRALPLTYSGFFTSGNLKAWGISGLRSDGRSFFAHRGQGDGETPFPATMIVPAPSSTDMDLALLFESDADVVGLAEQVCLVPLPDPLPPVLNVQFSLPSAITGPAGLEIDLDQAVMGPISFEAENNLSPNGFDLVIYENTFHGALPGELAVTSFMRILPPMTAGSSILGPTPEPFVYPGQVLWVGVDSFRSEDLPASFEQLFGPDLEAILQALPRQDHPTCMSSNSREYTVIAPGP